MDESLLLSIDPSEPYSCYMSKLRIKNTDSRAALHLDNDRVAIHEYYSQLQATSNYNVSLLLNMVTKLSLHRMRIKVSTISRQLEILRRSSRPQDYAQQKQQKAALHNKSTKSPSLLGFMKRSSEQSHNLAHTFGFQNMTEQNSAELQTVFGLRQKAMSQTLFKHLSPLSENLIELLTSRKSRSKSKKPRLRDKMLADILGQDNQDIGPPVDEQQQHRMILERIKNGGSSKTLSQSKSKNKKVKKVKKSVLFTKLYGDILRVRNTYLDQMYTQSESRQEFQERLYESLVEKNTFIEESIQEYAQKFRQFMKAREDRKQYKIRSKKALSMHVVRKQEKVSVG